MTNTTMVETEKLTSGMVIVTKKTGTRLSLHAVIGMPGDRTLLGHILNADGSRGQNEAWPIRDIAQVRVEIR